MQHSTVLDDAPVQRERGSAVAYLLLTALALLLLAFYAQVAHRTRPGQDHFGDFRHFYFAARALLDHTDLYTSGTGGYLYPPLIAFVYTPVARLAYRHAALVMLAVNVLLDFFGVLLASNAFADRFDIAEPRTPTRFQLVAAAALLGVLFNVDKVHLELQMFQTNALMFFLFALSLFWLDRRPVLAGLPLGFILNIKYLSLAMLPWLAVRRRWKTLAAFIASAVGFALLPATISGWRDNLHNLAVAYGGLLHMVGVGSGTEQSNVDPIDSWFSCSITSAMARLTHLGVPLPVGLAIAAAIGLLVLLGVVLLYREQKLPLFAWPPAQQQRRQPWRAVLGLEFTALVILTLCFSPQTNTRHLLLALLVTIPAWLLILGGRRQVPKAMLLVGLLIELAGFVLPPGNSSISGSKSPALLWLGVAGPSWCMMIALATLLAGGMAQAKPLDAESANGRN